MAVFTAISAALAGLTLSTFFSAVGTALFKTAVGLGLNKLLAKRPSAQAGPVFAIKGKLSRGADVPQSFILGRIATAGTLVYANTWGQAGATPNAFLTMVISLSDLPLPTLGQGIWVDGKFAAIDGVNNANLGTPVTAFAVDGKQHMWVKFYDGTQTTADAYMVNNVSTAERPWDATAVGVGVAYAIVHFRRNAELFNGFPQVKFVPHSIPFYDISKDSSVGGNGTHRYADPATWGGDGDDLPAVQIYNIRRGIFYAGEWYYGMQTTTAAQLPAAHWVAQVEKCRALIAGASGLEPTFRSGVEITINTEPLQAERVLLDACGGRMSEAGGVYKLHVGAPAAPVLSFTDDDILSTEEESFTPFFGLDKTVNGISGQFYDPKAGWQVETAPRLIRPDLEAEDGGRRLLQSFLFEAVSEAEQVQRLMKSALNKARRAKRHTFSFSPGFWPLEAEDVITWTSVRNGYVNKQFIIDGVVDQANLDVLVDATEIDPSDDNFDTLTDYTPPVVVSTTPQPIPTQIIQGWSAEAWSIRDAADAPLMPAIRVSWPTGEDDLDDIDAVQVEVRVKATGHIVFAGRFDNVAAGEGIISQAIAPATQYEVHGKFIAGSPRPVDWTAWLVVTTLDLRIPIGQLANDVTTAINDAATSASAELAAANAAADDALAQAGLSKAAKDAALLAQQASEDASADATASQSVVSRIARDLLPSDFSKDSLFWTHAISGDPDAKADLGPEWVFKDDAIKGRIATVALPQVTNRHLAPKGLVSNPVIGRTYRMTVQARHVGAFAVGETPIFKVQFRKLNGSFAFISAPTFTPEFTAPDVWETFVFDRKLTGVDAAYLLPFAYASTAYSPAGVELQFAEIMIEDVTDSVASGVSAAASVAASQAAATSETNAGTEASAATAERIAAETAAGQSLAYRNTSAVSSSDAEGFSVAAFNSSELAARNASNGVLSDPYFKDFGQGTWEIWTKTPTVLTNEVYETGNTLKYNVTTSSQDAGVKLPNSISWIGAQNEEAYVVEVVFTLVSGSLSGAGVRLDWDVGATDFLTQFSLASMLQKPVILNQVTTAKRIFKKPSGFTGTFTDHDLWVFANFVAFTKATKDIRFHRCQIRPATAEELGTGEVGSVIAAAISTESAVRVTAENAIATSVTNLTASLNSTNSSVSVQATAIADLQGNAAATYTMRAVAGPLGTELEMVSAYDPINGPTSLIRINAANIILNGTVGAEQIVFGLDRNRLVNTDFKAGLQDWQFFGTGTSSVETSFAVRPPGSWAGSNYPTIYLVQSGVATGGYGEIRARALTDANGTLQHGIPVEEGKWYDVSVKASLHRCVGIIYIFWRDINGAFVGANSSPMANIQSSSTNPELWPVYWTKGQAPVGAVYAQAVFRKNGTISGTDSWIFIHKPSFAETHASAVAPTPYSYNTSTLIAGGNVVTNSITADHMAVGTITAASGVIADLAVDRLQIADQAVTIPAYAYGSAVLPIQLTTDINLITVTIDRDAHATWLSFVGQQIVYAPINGNGGTRYSIWRGATKLIEFDVPVETRPQTIAYNFVDTDLGTGVTTYTVKAKKTNSGSGNQASKQITLQATQTFK